ncbi:MAG: hypothetical protein RI945_6 [Candidatus Parcubacteria bacterium]|jgi:hypothetical protein
MKKLFVLCSFVMICFDIFAQDKKDSIKVSGSITFQTQTNALVTGGRFSDKPALKGLLVFSKRNFNFSITRNSDLVDPKNNANFTSSALTFSKKLNQKFKVSASTEVFVFDANKDMNLLMPSGTVTYIFGKNFSTGFTAFYLKFLEGDPDAYSLRFDVGKKVEKFGLEARVYGWFVDWNGENYSAVAEISKVFEKRWKLSFFQHWNKFNNKASYAKFGVVRLAYSF